MVREVSQAAEVCGPDGYARLDLDADNSAVRGFEDHVDLDLVPIVSRVRWW